MTLRKIVPTLGLAAMASTGLQAADVGGLTVGGFVDTWLQVASYDEAAPTIDTDGDGIADVKKNDGDPDDLLIDFAAEVELQIGYKIGDNVTAQMDVEFYGGGGTYLETATITWDVTDKVSIMAGEFVNWLGWEAADAPSRYRFNRTILVSEGNFYGSKSTTGAKVGIAVAENASLGIFVVDQIYGEPSTKELADLGVGLDFTYDLKDIGLSINAELAYDINAAAGFVDVASLPAGTETDQDVLGLGLNATYTGTEGLVVGGELHYLDFDFASRYGLMAMANYAVGTNMSATVMFAYLEPNDDADDDEAFELTAALLTNPTGDVNFAVNYELSYISRGDLGRDGNGIAISDGGTGPSGDRNEIVAWAEFLAVIP